MAGPASESIPLHVIVGDWRLWPQPWRYGSTCLHRMCDEGIKKVRSGERAGLKFNVMGHERVEIDRYMRCAAPDVPYSV